MIKIQNITVEDFRGIRKLDLALGGKNFGICGPNGTGKSGIVDAIEFAVTGSITRLAGRGTLELSVKSHAPHVDSKAAPERAKVVLTGSIPSLNKPLTIERRVSAPAAPSIKPIDPKVSAIVAELETHPEFALSRREIIKYILTPPGERSKDVQALLRLDQIDKVRQALLKVTNEANREKRRISGDLETAKAELLQGLGVKTLNREEVLQSVNQQREILQLSAIGELTPTTSFKQGVVSAADKTAQQTKIKKATALADVSTLLESIEAGEAASVREPRERAIATLKDLKSRPALLKSLKKQILVQQGLGLLDEDACPLCDTAWNMAELHEHLQKKLGEATEASKISQSFETDLQPLEGALEQRVSAFRKAVQYGELLGGKLEGTPIAQAATAVEKQSGALEHLSSGLSDLDALTDTLSTQWWQIPGEAKTQILDLKKRLENLPDPSKEDGARDFLAVAQERYERVIKLKKESDTAAKQHELAGKAMDAYNASSTAVLEGLYKAVEADFSKYYGFINREDEERFQGKLTPSAAKLGFDVDFYGRGLFPPGAYHSEGHQDGMGLCLYLALMKQTLGDKFTFAVLDDVLMSVDAGHRREVCRLLKIEFPNTQFILTTHDPVWLQYMRTEGLIQSSVSFSSWAVDVGPRVWDDQDVWTDIADHLDKNKIADAAGTLRRYLEYTAGLLADRLRAKVEFRGNGQYDLGDLMPPVLRAWKTLLQEARKSAESWGQKEKAEQIKKMEADAKAKVASSSAEQWAINKALHYNEWATLQKAEFAVVVTAFKDLLATMSCPQCQAFLYVAPPKGDQEAVRCDCGETALNLKAK